MKKNKLLQFSIALLLSSLASEASITITANGGNSYTATWDNVSITASSSTNLSILSWADVFTNAATVNGTHVSSNMMVDIDGGGFNPISFDSGADGRYNTNIGPTLNANSLLVNISTFSVTAGSVYTWNGSHTFTTAEDMTLNSGSFLAHMGAGGTSAGSVSVNTVPEPSGLLLFSAGSMMLTGYRKRKTT